MYVDGERRPEIATSNEEFGCAAEKSNVIIETKALFIERESR